MFFFHRTRFDFYYLKKFNISWALVVHALNTSTQEAEVGSQEDLCEIEASLVYRVSSRTAKTTERNPVSKKQTKKHNIYLAF